MKQPTPERKPKLIDHHNQCSVQYSGVCTCPSAGLSTTIKDKAYSLAADVEKDTIGEWAERPGYANTEPSTFRIPKHFWLSAALFWFMAGAITGATIIRVIQ